MSCGKIWKVLRPSGGKTLDLYFILCKSFKDNMAFILGKKIGMTRVFDQEGMRVPVSLVEAGPCTVTLVKENSVQIGFGIEKHINKPKSGHVKKAGKNHKYLKEFKLEQPSTLKVGDKITINTLKVGDKAMVIGTGKGKGYAGVVKRHHFSGGPKTHGSDQHRAPGSIGDQAHQRVVKGRRMAGHMGHERVTVKNLEIIEIVPEKNLIALKGAIPGANNSLVQIIS